MTKEQDKFDKLKPKLDNVLEQITANVIEQRINIDEQEEAIERIEELRDSYELHQRSWANRCLDIIEDYVKNSVYKNKILEEDKAIEKLKKYIENDDFYNIYKEIKEDKRQGKIGGTYIDFCNAIETVLSMLKEKDKEIEKKDKIIDLMADYIATLDIEEDICANVENDNCDKMNFGECEDCIKQYFERKVE